MFCKHCGTALDEGISICTNCGAAQETQQHAVTYATPITPVAIPEENRPLSAWAYFGLQLLFAVPVVGFIFLIIFSFNGSNINRRNFARSHWCALLVFTVLLVIIAALAVIAGVGVSELLSSYS